MPRLRGVPSHDGREAPAALREPGRLRASGFSAAKHAWARKAAIAARYFAGIKPELGLAYRRHILATIQQTTVDNFNEQLSQFARENGTDPKLALAALDDPRLVALVERDFQDGVARGVVKTPTVFVRD